MSANVVFPAPVVPTKPRVDLAGIISDTPRIAGRSDVNGGFKLALPQFQCSSEVFQLGFPHFR